MTKKIRLPVKITCSSASHREEATKLERMHDEKLLNQLHNSTLKLRHKLTITQMKLAHIRNSWEQTKMTREKLFKR